MDFTEILPAEILYMIFSNFREDLRFLATLHQVSSGWRNAVLSFFPWKHTNIGQILVHRAVDIYSNKY